MKRILLVGLFILTALGRMNIGYNSCTFGARKIREIEAAAGFNIPWALFLEIDADTFAQHRDA